MFNSKLLVYQRVILLHMEISNHITNSQSLNGFLSTAGLQPGPLTSCYRYHDHRRATLRAQAQGIPGPGLQSFEDQETWASGPWCSHVLFQKISEKQIRIYQAYHVLRLMMLAMAKIKLLIII